MVDPAASAVHYASAASDLDPGLDSGLGLPTKQQDWDYQTKQHKDWHFAADCSAFAIGADIACRSVAAEVPAVVAAERMQS